jgi:hypothetical protein
MNLFAHRGKLLESAGAVSRTWFRCGLLAANDRGQRAKRQQTICPHNINAKLTYAVAGNENLAKRSRPGNQSYPESDLEGTFDLIVGVNTTRYAHRLDREENELARDIKIS